MSGKRVRRRLTKKEITGRENEDFARLPASLLALWTSVGENVPGQLFGLLLGKLTGGAEGDLLEVLWDRPDLKEFSHGLLLPANSPRPEVCWTFEQARTDLRLLLEREIVRGLTARHFNCNIEPLRIERCSELLGAAAGLRFSKPCSYVEPETGRILLGSFYEIPEKDDPIGVLLGHILPLLIQDLYLFLSQTITGSRPREGRPLWTATFFCAYCNGVFIDWRGKRAKYIKETPPSDVPAVAAAARLSEWRRGNVFCRLECAEKHRKMDPDARAQRRATWRVASKRHRERLQKGKQEVE